MPQLRSARGGTSSQPTKSTASWRSLAIRYSRLCHDDESGIVQALPLEGMAEGKSRIVKKVKEKRVIRSTKGTESNPDGDQILDATLEFEMHDKVKCLGIAHAPLWDAGGQAGDRHQAAATGNA